MNHCAEYITASRCAQIESCAIEFLVSRVVNFDRNGFFSMWRTRPCCNRWPISISSMRYYPSFPLLTLMQTLQRILRPFAGVQYSIQRRGPWKPLTLIGLHS